MLQLLLLLAMSWPEPVPVPRRDFRDVMADIEVLLEAGSKEEAQFLKLAKEIAGGVYDF